MSSDRQTPQTRSRRQFLQSSGVAAGAALGSLATPLAAQAACAAAPQTWDQTTDVLVVGTGFAGLTAAIEARLAGAEVLVIDKMPLATPSSTGATSARPVRRCRRPRASTTRPN